MHRQAESIRKSTAASGTAPRPRKQAIVILKTTARFLIWQQFFLPHQPPDWRLPGSLSVPRPTGRNQIRLDSGRRRHFGVRNFIAEKLIYFEPAPGSAKVLASPPTRQGEQAAAQRCFDNETHPGYLEKKSSLHLQPAAVVYAGRRMSFSFHNSGTFPLVAFRVGYPTSLLETHRKELSYWPGIRPSKQAIYTNSAL